MKAFDFSLFLEPLLRVDADLLSVREIYLRGPSPHTLLQMAHCCCFVTSNTPPLFLMPPPHSYRFPSGNGSWERRRDGWCCFELWHVSMWGIPLLFINNWPGPSVGAIYRADYCFARTPELYFFASHYLTESLISVKLFINSLTSGWFSLPQNRSDTRSLANIDTQSVHGVCSHLCFPASLPNGFKPLFKHI